MTERGVPMTFADLEARYRTRTPQSAAAFERARRTIAGGVQGNIKFFEPYPLTFRRGAGGWLEDVDGHRYVDYLLSFGALILGHGHPAVREAVDHVFREVGTTSFGMPNPLEVEMAERLSTLYPSMESVRFTNSGLEATLLAVRVGMAYTGRTHLAKFAGHYHGGHEHVLVTVHPDPEADGLDPSPDSYRLPDYYLDHTVVLPFNDFDACERLLRARQAEVGVVIAEPLGAGVVLADQNFMVNLRRLTQDLGMLLVFDEVKTGFRVALGGAQQFYGVTPDLTTLGKIVGGGFPIGVVGGRRDIMELCSPLRSKHLNEVVFHSGTFNGNPVSLAAGLATLRILDGEGVFPDLLQKTETLRRGIEACGREFAIPLQTLGAGAVFDVVVDDRPIKTSLDYERAPRHRRRALDFLLMERGVFSKPLNRFSLSIAHTSDDIAFTLEAFHGAMKELSALLSD
jgi:glutamate-1-semialdehyde 2,1-aminomutase